MARGQDAFQKRLQGLATENESLVHDVDNMGDMLALHQLQDTTAKGMLRKEIGGSIWQHGGEGKVTKYSSSKDLNNRYGLTSDRTAQSASKASSRYSSKQLGSDRKEHSHRTEDKPEKIHVTQSPAKTTSKIPSSSGQRTKLRTQPASMPLTVKGLGENVQDISGHGGTQNLDDTFFIESVTVATNQALGNTDPTSDTDQKNNLARMIKKFDYEAEFEQYRQLKGSEVNADHPSGMKRPCDPEVKKWLITLHLLDASTYIDIFGQYEMTIENVVHLTKEHLRKMDVKNTGVQNKILGGVERLRQQERRKLQSGSAKRYSGSPTKEHTANPSQETSHRNTKAAPTSQASGALCISSKTGASSSKSLSQRPGSGTVKERTKSPTKQTGVLLRKHSAGPSSSSRVSSPGQRAVRPVSAKEAAQQPKQGHFSVKIAKRPASASHALERRDGSGRKAMHVTIPTARDGTKLDDKAAEDTDEVDSGRSSSRSGQGSARGHMSPWKSPGSIQDMRQSPDFGDLLSVKTLHQQATEEVSHQDADEERSHSPSDTTEQKLQEVEMQVQSLQENLSNPAALKMINDLQTQLKAVQAEIVKDKKKKKQTPRLTSPNEVTQSKTKETDEQQPSANQIQATPDETEDATSVNSHLEPNDVDS